MTGPGGRSMGDDELAWAVAEDAGRLLVALRAELAGAPAAARRDEGDRRAHAAIVGALARARPGDAVLSEEGDLADEARLGADRVWIVDPLDGTREFGQPGRRDWAVHVALWVAGELTAAAVALPAEGLVLGTAHPPVLAPRPPGDPWRLAASRSRPSVRVHDLARRLGAELVPLGSAGAKAMAVVRGQADAYAHPGGLREWDVAAPARVAAVAGLHVSRLDGSAIAYNRPGVAAGDLLVCRAELAAAVLGGLRS